jgi:6-phosphogluconolactonase
VFFGDERRVPLDDPRSNYQQRARVAARPRPIPAGQIHPLTDADQYEGLLRAFFGEAPRFDLLMLGMGTTAHGLAVPRVGVAAGVGALGDRAARRGEACRG